VKSLPERAVCVRYFALVDLLSALYARHFSNSAGSLLLDELEEGERLDHPRAGRCVVPDHLDPLAQPALRPGERLVPANDGLVPDIIMHALVIAPRSGLAFAARPPHGGSGAGVTCPRQGYRSWLGEPAVPPQY